MQLTSRTTSPTSGDPFDGHRRRVTIYDIGQTCGVSAMTVSRVINGRPDVARSTRVAVEAAIDTLGYRPNGAARILVHGRSRPIGVAAVICRYCGHEFESSPTPSPGFTPKTGRPRYR